MSLAVSIDPIFWLLCAIGFVVLEAMTWNLVSIWFAVGSAAALLSCLLVQSFRVQAAVFIAVSALCLLAFKPLAKAAQSPHRHQRRPQPGPGSHGADPCDGGGHRPRPAGRRGLERPLCHPG